MLRIESLGPRGRSDLGLVLKIGTAEEKI